MEEPIETIRRYDGVCPGCGRELSFDVANVRISPVDMLMEQSPASSVSRPGRIQGAGKRPTGIVSREASKSVEKPVPLALWLRRRNSASEDETEYASKILGPEKPTP